MEETLLCQEADTEPPLHKKENSYKLVCNIQGGPGSSINIDFIEAGVKLGLEGVVEKFSEVLNRDAVWKKTQKIAKLPKFICVQFMRFFWKPTPDNLDHAGIKCKILRPVSYSEVLDVYDFCSEALQTELRSRREKADRLADDIFKGKTTSEPSTSSEPMDIATSEEEKSSGAVNPSSLLPEGSIGHYELMGVVTHKGKMLCSA
jgi:ubiquitin carboxyl-terminal hydrolase 14